MRTEIKIRLLWAFCLVCLLGIAAQATYMWQLNQRLTAAGIIPDASISSIEKEILANLDEPKPTISTRDPFDWTNQVMSDPFLHLQQMQQQMDSLFGSFGAGSRFSQPGITSMGFPGYSPTIEVNETPTEYQIVIAVGPDADIELNTSVEENSLSLSGSIKSGANNQRNNFASTLVSQSRFSRTIELPQPVDELGLQTHQTEAGIVISLPKKVA